MCEDMLAKIGKLSMELYRCNAVCGVRFRGGIKYPEIAANPVRHNVGCKFTAGAVYPFRKFHASIPLAVLRVPHVGGFAQVIELIVKAIPVAVVNLGLRFLAGHDFPDNPMCRVIRAENGYDKAGRPLSCNRSGAMARITRVPTLMFVLPIKVMLRAFAPEKLPRLSVIDEALPKIINIWQNLRSHVNLLGWFLVRSGISGCNVGAASLYILTQRSLQRI